MQKSKNLILSNEALDQYHQELESIIQIKSLYLRSGLCLNDLSIETGIPAEHVKQVLNEKLHLTFFEFITKYKIAAAKRLLTKINDDHFSITNVAKESGFCTDESFVALFYKHTNMSPENYRIKYYNIDPNLNNPVKD